MLSTLLKDPRLFFTKAARRYTMSHTDVKTRLAFRNKWRKYAIDRDLPIPINHGFWMNVSPNDYATYGIYFFGNYDPEMTSVVKHYVKPGDTVWDIGTERGWFTLLMASIVGENGRVDSFEAFPPTVQKLKANVELNNFKNVNIVSGGVSDKAGKMWFVPPSDAVTGNQSFLENCNGVGYLTDKEEKGLSLIHI